MSNISRRVKQLEALLLGLPQECDPMLVTELDGFIAGIAVCPEFILPVEWLPQVWRHQDEDGAAFEDVNQAEKLLGLVVDHYNATIRDLQHGRYAPLFDVDTQHDEVIWELWTEGFEAAMQLRPDAWAAILDADGNAQHALGGLLTLVEIANGESELPEEELEKFSQSAPELITICVQFLHDWRMAQALDAEIVNQADEPRKVGRNDPCPCGSGKKYKKCCGRN